MTLPGGVSSGVLTLRHASTADKQNTKSNGLSHDEVVKNNDPLEDVPPPVLSCTTNKTKNYNAKPSSTRSSSNKDAFPALFLNRGSAFLLLILTGLQIVVLLHYLGTKSTVFRLLRSSRWLFFGQTGEDRSRGLFMRNPISILLPERESTRQVEQSKQEAAKVLDSEQSDTPPLPELVLELAFLTLVYSTWFLVSNGMWLSYFRSRPWWNSLRNRPGFVCANHQAELIMCSTLAPHHLLAGLLHIYGYTTGDVDFIRHGILWEAAFNLHDYICILFHCFPYNNYFRADHAVRKIGTTKGVEVPPRGTSSTTTTTGNARIIVWVTRRFPGGVWACLVHHFGALCFGLFAIRSDLLYREDMQRICIAPEAAAGVALAILAFQYTCDFRTHIVHVFVANALNTVVFGVTRGLEFPYFALSLFAHLLRSTDWSPLMFGKDLDLFCSTTTSRAASSASSDQHIILHQQSTSTSSSHLPLETTRTIMTAPYPMVFTLGAGLSILGFSIFNLYAGWKSTKRVLKINTMF
ncbi:unnamed protein product, partial [Amoebophrya sp. A25]|eukprot:GSA25T00027292001.1